MNHPEGFVVAHIIKGLGRGGAERLLVSSVRNHAKKFNFHVIFFLAKKDQLVAELTEAGATVHLISASSALGMLIKLPALMNLLRVINPRIIHAHLPLSAAMAALASRILKLPMVYTEHNLPSRYRRPTKLIHWFTIRQAVKILCVSQSVFNDVSGLYQVRSRIHVLENGIDTELFDATSFNKEELRKQLGFPDICHVIGTVAVFTPQKRLDRWLQICRKVYEKWPAVTFVLSGHGPLMDKLQSDALDLLEKKVIIFTDRTTTPEKWMASMDIYLMSSDYEGMPLALLEAMSLSLPVVASAVGGIPTVIDDAVNGLLYQPEDIDCAAVLIERLIRDHQLCDKLGVAARDKVVQRFSIKRMVAELEKVYLEMIESKILS